MSDHLLPIRRKVLEILTQSNGSENIFTLLRKVEEDVEWVNLGCLSEAIQDADSLVRRGNSVFLTQEIQPEAPVRVEQVAQPLFPGEWQFIRVHIRSSVLGPASVEHGPQVAWPHS